MGFINLEIKARCSDPGKVEKILLEKNARFVGSDHQVDTYFQVASGRLKLREGVIENALIFYHRHNQSGPKVSDVELYKTTPNTSLKNLLVAALGVKVIVDKHRKIFFIDNIKFHIDVVKGLGSFIEIEAIDQEMTGNKALLEKQCTKYMQILEIEKKDLVSESYSDLLNG
ncbi:MAG: class IV adenylate cyclase [Bacteroidetes bacterium]|nr:class IV adenylate cyclase [Bacteroidota bacterium]